MENPIGQQERVCHRALEVDDIIFKIMDYLDIEDLCSLSRTCKRIRTLGKNYFDRKYHMKQLFAYQSENEIQLMKHAKCIKCFVNQVQNVILQGRSSTTSADKLITFLTERCSQNLKEICFSYMNLDEEHGVSIQANLKNVENIIFRSCKIDGNIFNNFLKYCLKLKHLVLWNCELNASGTNIWITGELPTLESLHVAIRRKIESEYWIRFFQENINVPQLKTIYLNGSHPVMRPIVKCAIQRAINLKNLYLSVSDDFELASITEEFMELDNNESFERLSMEFDGIDRKYLMENAELFSKLQKLNEIYFDYIDTVDNFLFGLSCLPNIKTLYLDGIGVDTIEFDKCYTNNLEELFIGYLAENVSTHKIILMFLLNSINLRKIIFYRTISTERFNKIQEHLSEYRDIRQTSETLDIYVCPARLTDVKLIPQLKNSLIKLKIFSELESYEFFMRNPFEQFSHFLKT